MPKRLDKQTVLSRLAELAGASGLLRVHPDAPGPTARAVLEALAGLPAYEQLWAGDVNGSVVLLGVLSGERVSGDELVRRSALLAQRALVLSERIQGSVVALQLVLYERPVPAPERAFVLGKARHLPFFGIGRARVATWLFALDEPALHARRFSGWPAELSAEELRQLLVSPAA